MSYGKNAAKYEAGRTVCKFSFMNEYLAVTCLVLVADWFVGLQQINLFFTIRNLTSFHLWIASGQHLDQSYK